MYMSMDMRRISSHEWTITGPSQSSWLAGCLLPMQQTLDEEGGQTRLRMTRDVIP